MATISSTYYEGNQNHLQQYYLYSPLKRLKDEKIHQIESTKDYLTNIESKYRSSPNHPKTHHKQFATPQSSSQKIDIGQNRRSSHLAKSNNVNALVTPQRLLLSSQRRSQQWPKIFDQNALQDIQDEADRIRSISPNRKEYTQGVITLANKKVPQEDHYQVLQQIKKQFIKDQEDPIIFDELQVEEMLQQQHQHLNFTETSTQNRVSVKSKHNEKNNDHRVRNSHPAFSNPQFEKFEYAAIQSSMTKSNQISQQNTAFNTNTNIMNHNNQIQNEDNYVSQTFNIHQHNQYQSNTGTLLQSSPKKPYKKIFSDRMAQTLPTDQQNQNQNYLTNTHHEGYQYRKSSSPQRGEVSIYQKDELKMSLVEFSKSTMKTKYERYYPVNGQIINHLIQLKDLEAYNTLQKFESEQVKMAYSVLLEMLKSFDPQSLQKQIQSIGEFIEQLQMVNSKIQNHQKSSILSQVNMIASQSIEHANSKLVLLIEDEERDLSFFNKSYEQVLKLGLQLLPKDKVYAKIKQYSVLKEHWYDYICNQTL